MVAINDDEDDQKKHITSAKFDPAKQWVYLCTRVASVLIIHLKVFIFVNIRHKPSQQAGGRCTRVGFYQFILKKKRGKKGVKVGGKNLSSRETLLPYLRL